MTDVTDALTRGRLTRALLCMVLAGASLGCAQTRSAPFAAREDVTIQVHVENRAFEDATIHAVWPGQRLRLGTTIGHTNTQYLVELETSVLISFEIRLLGGRGCLTEQIWADPGNIIVLEISPEFLERFCRRD